MKTFFPQRNTPLTEMTGSAEVKTKEANYEDAECFCFKATYVSESE